MSVVVRNHWKYTAPDTGIEVGVRYLERIEGYSHFWCEDTDSALKFADLDAAQVYCKAKWQVSEPSFDYLDGDTGEVIYNGADSSLHAKETSEGREHRPVETE